MERKIITTSDGSRSLFLPDLDETYHSRHGAIQEAYHVFIRSGLDLFEDGSSVSVLEMGYGTGLNCLITLIESRRRNLKVDYCGMEAYPVTPETAIALDYPKALGSEGEKNVFENMHRMDWEQRQALDADFNLIKRRQRFEEFQDQSNFDLVYFDAFGPRVQPELWTEEIFASMFKALRSNGVLVTYSAKGSVRRAMIKAGFSVERLPGPAGKREMLRALK